jgi:hypothetical protein
MELLWPGGITAPHGGDHPMAILFKTDIASAADLRVFITQVRSEADLIVYETTDRWAATESPIPVLA